MRSAEADENDAEIGRERFWEFVGVGLLLVVVVNITKGQSMDGKCYPNIKELE